MKTGSIAMAAAWLLTGCMWESSVIPEPEIPAEGRPNVSVRIRFPAADSDPVSKSLTGEDENRIDSLTVYVFEQTGASAALSDPWLYTVRVPGNDIHAVAGDPAVKRADLLLEHRAGVKQRLVFVANPPKGLNLSLEAGVSTQQEVMNQLKFSGAPWRTANLNSANHTAFPMWGQMKETFQIEDKSWTPPSGLSVDLIRAMVKIEVGVDLNGTGDPALGFGSVFWIDKVYVCNYSDSAHIAPHNDYLTAASVGKTNPVNRRQRVTAATVYAFPPAPAFPSTGEQRTLKRTIYIPETDSLFVDGDTVKPAFLVIEIKYYRDAASNQFYRIDFAREAAGATGGYENKPLLRNHQYTINLTGVRMRGYASLKEAEAAPVSNRNYALTLGDVDDEGKIREVVATTDYMLGVETSRLLMDWEERAGSAATPLAVKTDYPGGWTARFKGSAPGWCLLGDGSGALAAGPVNGPATGAGKASYLHIGAEANADAATPVRRTEIEITAGVLSKTIAVVQVAGSNTYLVAPGKTVRIPKSSANRDGTLRVVSGDGAGTVFPAGEGTVTDLGKVIEYVAPNHTGTAMIRSDQGWAWTIWIVDGGAETLENSAVIHNGAVFMNRNLCADGLADAGMYYQWGRSTGFAKAGLGGDWDLLTVAAPPAGGLNEALKHPDLFYSAGEDSGDWLERDQNNNLWSTVEGEKGIFDPCPFGWRVPPMYDNATSPWYGFTVNGVSGLLLPAAGGLDGSDGRMQTLVHGVWCASPRGMEAFLLRFDSTGAGPRSGAAKRTDAFPVRCIRDVKRNAF